MKLRKITLCAFVISSFLPSFTQADTESKPYDGSWESLQKVPVPAWFDDGKIGIFIHWGPYSAIGYRKGGRGYAEHVPKMLYQDPGHYYPYMDERWGAHPPEFGYKDIIPEFKAEKWEPEAWAELFKEAGAHYVVMTAEHHDGWANWDSDLTPWNAMDMGPKRDLVGDLGKSLKKAGLKYAPSYHRERHQSFFAKKAYVVDSEPQDAIAEEIKRVPEAASLYGPFGTSKEYVDDYVARWKEIQEKYEPDFLWIDDIPIWTRDGNNVLKGKAKPEVQYFYDQCRQMITDFMNDGAARGAEVYLNNKGANRNWPDGVGCLEKDNLKLKVIGPKWQSCTTFGTSFGYLEGDKYKSLESIIHEMVEVIARNGNFLVNIGPKADGTIPEPQVERLRAMGEWLQLNGDAIYGSRYWKQSEQKTGHLVFTTNGKKLYAIALKEPTSPIVIEGTKGWTPEQVVSVRLLGSEATIEWAVGDEGLRFTPPADLGQSKYAWTFEIVTTEEQHHPNVIETDASRALKGTRANRSAAAEEWVIDTGEEWVENLENKEGLDVADGMVSAQGEAATLRSVLKSYPEKRKPKAIKLSQSPTWLNWQPVKNLGPANLKDAPVFLRMGPDDYWMFGRYGGKGKAGKGVGSPAELEGFDIPLKTTGFANQFDAPGGLVKSAGGYHAWQSRDMVNWVHHGAVSDREGTWLTTAEAKDGKVYFYYDFPNDQDPHLIIDDDLTDGKVGKKMGLAFKDPSNGSDCAIIRDLDGKFHLIYEDWSPIDASKHAWDSPLAGHAVSVDGTGNFKIVDPAVDERTEPTGKFAEHIHPHWYREDPENFPGKVYEGDKTYHGIKAGQTAAFARYEIHEPAQDAFGDWAAISIGGQYYLFCDFDPKTAHGDRKAMSVAWFTSPSIDQQFSFCGNLGSGHPDPDVIFAEGQFYLATQMTTDYVSPGPWVDGVEVRVGVDTDNDGKTDQWSEWQEVKEIYESIPGFAKQVAKTPAAMDLEELPEGYGFQLEVKLTDTTENESKPVLDRIEMSFE
eukprot:g3671.t1